MLDLLFYVKYNKEDNAILGVENCMKKFGRFICLLLTLALLLGAGAFELVPSRKAFAAGLELVYGSTLSIDTSTATLQGLPVGITASTLKGNFKADVTVTDVNGNTVADSALVSTGCKVTFSGSKLTVVVLGDINGDGDFSTLDFIALKSHLKGISTLTGVYFSAADVTGDSMISTTDSVAIKSAFGGNADIYSALYGKTYVLTASVSKYATASDAAWGKDAIGTASAGTYYVHKSYPAGLDGMYLLTSNSTAEGTGFWMNPADLDKTEDSSTVDSSVEDSSEDESSTVVVAATYTLVTTVNKYNSAADAAAQTNATGTLEAGTYYIYSKYPNGYNGMYNLTTDSTGAQAGNWVNPAENVKPTAATYVLSQDMPKYASSADAVNSQNSTGTASAGTYYIYNKYPNGYNGVYNITTDSTGEVAGFWINPADAAPADVGTLTLVRPVNKYATAVNAVNQANVTGTATAGTYYIYNGYPNGLNGMYNLTTDSTGASAGFWVNPKENTTGRLNYDTTKAVWLSQFDLASVYVQSGTQNTKSAFTYRIKKTLQAIKDCGYNTIIVQVRPNGDALYKSAYYPWSKYAVGSYGKTASYDPFEIIVEQAYDLALSVHAWVNPMRLMSTSEITSVSSSYVIRQWYNDSTKKGTYIVAVNGTYYLNPGYEEVRNLIINGVTELCTNYNIDGIHFDDYFYPDGVTNSFDQAAFAASGQASRATWRRLCVSAFVKGTYNAVKAVDSELIFGISPAGSITNNMNALYADVKTWCSTAGYVDYVAPQLYWGFEHPTSPFDDMLDEWEALMKNASVKLIPAVTLAKANGETDSNDGTEWTKNKDVIKRQLNLIENCKNFGGVMVFSLADFYNPAANSYVSAVTSERANFEPVLKAMYVG